MLRGPRTIALLAAGALASCYSPSIESCRLACAAGDACPSGLSCVQGRCAAPGETCAPAGCGDQVRDPGEVCFGPAITADTAFTGIRHLQLANLDRDPNLEIVFTVGSSLHAYELEGGALVALDPVTEERVDLVRALQLDSTDYDELVVVEQEQLRVLTMQAAVYATQQIRAFEPGLGAPVDLRPSSLDVRGALLVGHATNATLLTYNENLSKLSVAGSQSVSELTGLAVGDLGGDLANELVIVTPSHVEIWDANLEKEVAGRLEVAGVAGAVVGDVLGDSTAELVYGIGATANTIGTLAAARLEEGKISSTYDEIIPDFVGALELADVDGDGRSDLVSLLAGRRNAALVMLGGDTLSERHEVALPIEPRALARPADLDGDGAPDLVITDGSRLVVLPSNP